MLHISFLFLIFILGLASWLTSALYKLLAEGKLNTDSFDDIKEELGTSKAIFFWSIPLLIVGYGLYHLIVHLGWQAHVMDWLNLLIRWFHVVIGIAWIGASFYFIFLENSLNRTENLRDELAGNLWAVHGGGFYYLEKYKTAPKILPKTLHWFKYEAYFTWLTGIFLLMIVYYLNAESFMIDPAVSSISPSTAICIGIGTLIFGWIVYDLLCRSPLLAKKKTFALIGFGILVGISIFLTHFLSGRAAFIHIGALLGTIMVGNVFFVIIPAQKALVKAAKAGLPVNPELGKYAGLRSLHNNYTTLPVIFIMISNHFPSTFGGGWNWLILSILILGSVAIRHYINMHEKGQNLIWLLPIGAISIFAAVIISAPKSISTSGDKIRYAQVEPIFQQRCVSCHASQPTDEVTKVAPAGTMFETYDQCFRHKDKILNRAVETKTMPQGNKTKITEEERELLGKWIKQGALE
jgi:uncharacterized membrane protein